SKNYEPSFGMLISPLILVIGVVLIGIMPNLFNETFLAHAATSISGETNFAQISYWHGFSTPFIMSLAVLGIGTVLYTTMNKYPYSTYFQLHLLCHLIFYGLVLYFIQQ